VEFKLDRAGVGEVLKAMTAKAVADVAQEIAAAAGDDAVVELGVSDRARALVMVPAEQQALDGVLSRAAAAAGLEVRARVKSPKKSRTRKKP